MAVEAVAWTVLTEWSESVGRHARPQASQEGRKHVAILVRQTRGDRYGGGVFVCHRMEGYLGAHRVVRLVSSLERRPSILSILDDRTFSHTSGRRCTSHERGDTITVCLQHPYGG